MLKSPQTENYVTFVLWRINERMYWHFSNDVQQLKKKATYLWKYVKKQRVILYQNLKN